jgi:sulfate adenylyltransferase subunit 1 (EFTu-like GTPase family)
MNAMPCKRPARAEGMEFEYAFLLDALLEEQEQNITIDTTQIQFRTAAAPTSSSTRPATRNSSRT